MFAGEYPRALVSATGEAPRPLSRTTLLPRMAPLHRTSGYWESTAMTAETKKNLRTVAGVIVWVAMLALSQESAAMLPI